MKTQIPDKLYYKIGEVSKITGVKPYVLRYWESEFKIISPTKTRSNHRLYKREDLDLILEIKNLLKDQRFTIEGAKKEIRKRQVEKKRQVVKTKSSEEFKEVLRKIKKDLLDLRVLGKKIPGRSLLVLFLPGCCLNLLYFS